MRSRAAKKWLIAPVSVIALMLLVVAIFRPSTFVSVIQILRGRATVSERLAQFGPVAEPRLKERFAAAGVAYPPKAVLLLCMKQGREVHVYAAEGSATKEVAVFPILGASGRLGPKLREGDQQVPEGFYRIESLNPNSLYHLSMRLDYPNEEDCRIAAAEGRQRLGGDIMIHGKTGSIGCIALGDPAIEELFILAARVGVENVQAVIAPCDRPMSVLPNDATEWLKGRYQRLQARIDELRSISSPFAGSDR